MRKNIKKVEPKEISRLIEKEGYAVYNPENYYYYYDDFSEVRNLNEAFLYESIEYAKEDILEYIDNPYEYEIHKVKITFATEQVYTRKVTYELKEENKID